MRDKKILILFLFVFVSCIKNDEFSKIDVVKEMSFGTIHSNQEIKKNYKIKNTSENDLKIKSVRTSCNCTATKISDSILKKNETLDLEVNFSASKEKIGIIKSSIVIEANTSPVFTVLYLKGKVIK